MTEAAVQDKPDSKLAETWSLAPRSDPAGDAESLTRWRAVRDQVRALALREGLTKSEVSRRSAVPLGTLSPWYDGTYPGQLDAVTTRVERWLAAVEEMRSRASVLPEAPGYVTTPTSEEVIDALLYAQTMPDIAVITLGAGMGKTMTAEHFAATRPNVFIVTMRPTTINTHVMLQELAQVLDVQERNPSRLDRSIGLKLKRNGRHPLLIVDEAQNLTDTAVNQLRYYHDEYKCGIALLGNNDLFGRYGKGDPKEGYGQLHRRMGKRLQRLRPKRADVDALLDAWSIDDEEARRLLHGVALKPGALGQVDKTIRGAFMRSAAQGRPLSVEHVRAAWNERSGEDLPGRAA